MNTYYGNWSTNNGNTFNGAPYISKNKKQLRKELRDVASGNLTDPTDRGRWPIIDDNHNLIMEGHVNW
jgi:hypothetical protein